MVREMDRISVRRIALVHYSAPPVVGGVESVLAHHARLMADAGHSVQIIAGRGAQFDARVPFVSLPLVDSRHPDVLAAKADLDSGRVSPRFVELASALTGLLREALAGFDVVIAHNVCSLHKNLALTAALRDYHDRAKTCRLILWHHDLAWTTPRYRAELHDGYPWDLIRRDWPGVQHVAVSESRRGELAELMGLSPQTIAVVPSGVDAATFLKLEPQTREFVARLGLLEAEPLLLLPVRITPRKNIELALHTLAALLATSPKAALVVSGPPGPHNPANPAYFARLKALRAELGLAGRAHFLAELTDEYLPDAVIADLYRLADALLMPSREEGFGIPIIEAGLARLPVFCADIPPLRSLGGDQATYFSPDADPRAVAGLIAERLAADRDHRLAVRIRHEYLWEQVYARKIAPLLDS
jgi:glycosyltransferase involved in cell wall biosynthesis